MRRETRNITFAVKCFRNGKRRWTHKLSRSEAASFHRAARHLAQYLAREYKLDRKSRPKPLRPRPIRGKARSYTRYGCIPAVSNIY